VRERLYSNHELRWLPAFPTMVGPMPPNRFISNGATCAPDVLFTADIRPAAHWHDYAYSDAYQPAGGRNEETRYRADIQFYHNLRLCGLPRWVALVYYFRVRLWGHYHYHYTPRRNEPRRTVRFWLGLLFGRYIRW